MSIPTPTLLDRFCRYVRIDTQADERRDDLPQLARPARARPDARSTSCSELGLTRRRAGRARHRPGHHSRRRVARRRPSPGSPTSTPRRRRPARTSSRSSTANYDGGDIVLPGDPTKVHPRRRQPGAGWRCVGKTIITTDGTTLLGRRRQGRRRRHHGGGRAPADAPRDPARARSASASPATRRSATASITST